MNWERELLCYDECIIYVYERGDLYIIIYKRVHDVIWRNALDERKRKTWFEWSEFKLDKNVNTNAWLYL